MKTYAKKTAPLEFEIESIGQDGAITKIVFQVKRKTREEMNSFSVLLDKFNAEVEAEVSSGKHRIMATADSNINLLAHLFDEGTEGYSIAQIKAILTTSLDPGTIADLALDVVKGLFNGSRS